jgi:gamma-glutamyltranspeptidase/glutathione hydrolase
MTLDDLKNFKVSIREPISITYKDYNIYSCGVPSGGSVALSILKIIEGYSNSNSDSERNLSYHRLNEAMRFSYAARSELGDPDFFGYMFGFEAKMLESATAERIRKRISDHRTHNVSHYSPVKYSLPDNHGTSHIVTTDASGMSITSTSTVNLLWGSLLVVPETGMLPLSTLRNFFFWKVIDVSRSNNERRNERLLYSRHPKRIRLHP